MLLRPKSKGHVRLKSLSPYANAKVEAGYFSHPSDIKVLVEAVKFALALGETHAFKKLGSRFWDKVPMPGCEHTELWGDEYWACICRHYTTTIYHYSGTAKMGPPTDPGSVVNHELKMYGVRGLRVIDASIMPKIPSGNTNAPVIMLAEKGADLIKDYWYARRRRHSKRSADNATLVDEFADWPEKVGPSRCQPDQSEG